MPGEVVAVLAGDEVAEAEVPVDDDRVVLRRQVLAQAAHGGVHVGQDGGGGRPVLGVPAVDLALEVPAAAAVARQLGSPGIDRVEVGQHLGRRPRQCGPLGGGGAGRVGVGGELGAVGRGAVAGGVQRFGEGMGAFVGVALQLGQLGGVVGA